MVDSEAGEGVGAVSRREIAVLVAIVALGAVLRAWGLASKSFWVDEIVALERSRSLRQAIAFCSLGHEPPLRYCLLHWLLRFSPPELFARLPSFVLGVATIALLWLVARDLFGPRVGAVAAFLLSVSPWHIIHSQDARMYAVMMFFWVLSLLLFFEVLRRPRRVLLWPALAVVHVANLYLSYLTVFVLAAEALVLVGWLAVRKWREGARFDLKPYGVGAFIFAGFFGVLVSFWFHPLAALFNRYLGLRPPAAGAAIRAVYEQGRVDWPTEFDAGYLAALLDRLLVPGAIWRIVALVALSAGLSVCWRRNRTFVWLAVLSFFIGMAAILFTAMRHFVAPRYLFHVLIFSTVAIAAAIVGAVEAALGAARSRGQKIFAAALLAAVGAAALYSYVPVLLLHVRCERQDWRAACRFLEKNARPGDLILTGPWGAHVAVLYYGRSSLTDRHRIVNCLTVERMADEIEQAGGDKGVWYIAWGYVPSDLRLVIEEHLERVAYFRGLRGTISVYRRRSS